MKIARFSRSGEEKIGFVSGKTVATAEQDSIQSCMGVSDSNLAKKCSKEKIPLAQVKLLPPVTPSKIICLGWNYAEHVEELKNAIPEQPMVFLKPPSAVIGDGDDVVLPSPRLSTEVNNEVELAVVMGKEAKGVQASKALDHVLGYTIMQDITARDIQYRLRQKNEQWGISKAFDTFAPLGPWIATKSDIPDPHKLSIRLKVNGVVRQDSNTSHMIFKIPHVIEYLSSVMTLMPGDVISTGTPKGVDLIKHGDLLEAEIEGVGVLRNRVISTRK